MTTDYTLGMTGPISVAQFRDFIDPGQWSNYLPAGQGGTPVNFLCRELLRRGQKLIIFSCDPSIKEEIVITGRNLRICLGPLGSRPARNFFRTARAYLKHAILRERPDIIHAQWTYEYALPVQRMGIPHIITAHDTPLRCLWHNLIPFRVAKTIMAYRVMSRARRVVCVSPYVAKHIKRYGLYKGPELVIPNGLPTEAFVDRSETRLKGPRVTFGTVLVGWGAYKNGQAAIKAFAQLRKRAPDARLLMFGSEHGDDEAAAAWARERGLQSGIEFVGALPYGLLMERLANEVDVLVHPSLVEAQSMALIEAMARGIPVIGGRQSGAVPWTLNGGRAGLLVDVRSVDAIAEAMYELSTNEKLRQTLAVEALEYAKREFHIASVTDAWQALYERLAGEI